MRPALTAFAVTALAVGITWWWLGTPVKLPPSPLGPDQKLYCVSYAPFRDGQDPLVEGTQIPAAQIEADLTLLSKYTDCVRTYSVDIGLDQVPEIARRHGLKVLLGLWLSGVPDKTRLQIDRGIELAKAYSDVIRGVVVGNEVLLRGEMSEASLAAIIHEVKSQIPEPVTYADVWEYWLRYRDLANSVDFVTIHILPYWEDFPIPAAHAAAHVDDIRKKVALAIPNKDILIGEVGWPSAGRMREGARPSPSNQALVIDGMLALAQRENFRVNVIEAFDQSWKRWLEGSVGGHWGIFDRGTGRPKFSFAGGAVSDHPYWPFQALAGIVLAALVFGATLLGGRDRPSPRPMWWKTAALAVLPAVLFGWTLERIPIESFTAGGWLRSLALAAIAVVAPIACAMACAMRRSLPAMSDLLGGSDERRNLLTWLLGATSIAVVVLSLQAALGLVFDPRYRDIPFAPLAGAIVPMLALSVWSPRPGGPRAKAEWAAAILLGLSAVYVVFNESIANWQADWFCAALLVLAFSLSRVRAAPG
jgi:glucan 1,3-beta-glucosidase